MPGREDAGPTGVQPEQVSDSFVVEGEKGVKDGSDQDAAAGVRLLDTMQCARVRLPPLPLVPLVLPTQGIAQRAVSTRGAPEFLRQLTEDVLGLQIPAGVGDL